MMLTTLLNSVTLGMMYEHESQGGKDSYRGNLKEGKREKTLITTSLR